METQAATQRGGLRCAPAASASDLAAWVGSRGPAGAGHDAEGQDPVRGALRGEAGARRGFGGGERERGRPRGCVLRRKPQEEGPRSLRAHPGVCCRPQRELGSEA